MPFARVQQVDLYYELEGQGEALVLIHGLGSDANTWQLFLPEVEPQYRILRPENRGSARSSKPEGESSTIVMAEDIAALMQTLGIDRAHVVGKSMGGMIAQHLAARYPEKVQSLVLASTVMRHDPYGEELLQMGRLTAQKAGIFASFRLAFLLSYSRGYCAKNQSRLAEVEEMMKKMDSEEVLRGYMMQSLACEKHDSREAATRIQASTLVIVGEDDMITPPEASRDLAKALPKSELHVLPGGHGFWREFPDKVNPVVRNFLSHHRR